MNIDLNRNYRLFIAGEDKPLSCVLESLYSNGNVVFRGDLPDTQRLLAVGRQFEVRGSDNQVAVKARIIKIEDKGVDDVTALRPGDTAPIGLEIEALCEIEYCKFFEAIE